MKRTFGLLAILAAAIVVPTVAGAQNTYVGVKGCTMCHKSEKQGLQLAIWEKSKHASAYATLKTDKANEIAKAKGLAKPAVESPECLECHAIKGGPDAADVTQGVQCESCHGAGSGYKAMATMKSRDLAVKGGLHVFADQAAVEAMCKTCHNEKSPTNKPFNFEERWKEIAHKKPAA
ncbi:MAG: cytochrome c family protein [Gemmatimonadaceae bacterium]|nr:cytochrome c family protein [Gemmatimonadaceae bacterium]